MGCPAFALLAPNCLFQHLDCKQFVNQRLFPALADYPNNQNFILHYADMVDSTSLTNLLKYVPTLTTPTAYTSILFSGLPTNPSL